MKWSTASLGVIVLGIIGVMVIVLFQQLTTSNESDYYLLKEITESAMIESIDLKYYRETGDLKIVKEKFVENFTRRYSQSTLFAGTKYTIKFFDIIEEPPKATIIINTGLEQYRIYDTVNDYNVYNNLTGILEYVGKNTSLNNESRIYTTNKVLEKTYYAVSSASGLTRDFTEPINLPKELQGTHIKDIKPEITSSNIIGPNNPEAYTAVLKEPIDWARTSSVNKDIIIDNNYTTSIAGLRELSIYNCENDFGTKISVMCEGNYKNNTWVHFKGTVGDPDQTAILKLNIKFTYSEYEYK